MLRRNKKKYFGVLSVEARKMIPRSFAGLEKEITSLNLMVLSKDLTIPCF